MERLGSLARAAAAFATLTITTPLTTACGDDCGGETEAAREFLSEPTHRTCQTSDDRAVVHTGCSGLGFCGQAQLNKSTAAGEAWRSREKLLTECANGCAVCGAAVVPTCSEGLCGAEL